MKVGIIQSNYIPWRGYFDFIDEVDLFVFHDDLQYTKRDWRNRNRIKTPRGLEWLTVPVHYRHTDQKICETEIDQSTSWAHSHLNRFVASYRAGRYVDDAHRLLAEGLAAGDRGISDLNVRLIRLIGEYLGITTPLVQAADYRVTGAKTERLIALLRCAGATCYLSGPAAKAYLDEAQFRREGIRLEYKVYDYPPYPQLWGSFEGGVTILDLIASVGPEARAFLKSRSPNEVAEP